MSDRILEHIVRWSESREDIRLILMGGSRAYPGRAPDELSDYDIEVYTRTPERYSENEEWINEFGTILVRWPRHPAPTHSDHWITQLVIYEDGLRIDFQITSVDTAAARGSHPLDNGYVVLLDKDGLARSFPSPTYRKYLNRSPTEDQFIDRINAFFWDITYVAKALLRNELNYARFSLDSDIRFNQLLPLLEWYVGVTKGWDVPTGKFGRWLGESVDPPAWRQYESTFADSSPEAQWAAMDAAVALVRHLGSRIAKELGYRYPNELDAGVAAYLKRLHARLRD